MPIFPLQYGQEITTAGGTFLIDITESVTEYTFYGTGNLLASVVIAPDPAMMPPTQATLVRIFYNCNLGLNGNTLTIFGENINLQQALNGNVLIEAIYDGFTSSWIVVVKESDSDLIPLVEGVTVTTIDLNGGTPTPLVAGIDSVWQEYIGNGDTLIASFNATCASTSGYFFLHYTGTLVPNGNNVTFCGLTLTDAQVTNGNVLILAYYDAGNSVWRAQLCASPTDIDYKGVDSTVITGGVGVTVTLQDGVSKQTQVLTGSGALGGNCLVTWSGTFADGAMFFIKYDATTTGFSVNILGETLTLNQQLFGECMVIATYDLANTTFVTQLVQTNSASNSGVINGDISGIAFTATIDSSTKQFIRLYGSGALGGNCIVNSTGTFEDGQTFLIKYDAATTGFSVDILGEILTADQQLYGDCMVIATYDLANTTFVTQLVVNPSTSTYQKEVITIPVSFNSGLQANNSFIVPYNAVIEQLDAFVTEALSATDAGTITVDIAGVPVTNGVVTIPLSSALNTQASATPSALNVVTAGDVVSAVSAKTMVGGAALLSVTLLRTP